MALGLSLAPSASQPRPLHTELPPPGITSICSETIHDTTLYHWFFLFSTQRSSEHVSHQKNLFAFEELVKLRGWGVCWSVLAHFNFLGETVKHCDWMAVIYATQAATVQSWIGLSSHSSQACWLWGLFYFFEEDRLLAFCHSELQLHMNAYISRLLWQQNILLQSHKWRICAISTYTWKHITKHHYLLRWNKDA